MSVTREFSSLFYLPISSSHFPYSFFFLKSGDSFHGSPPQKSKRTNEYYSFVAKGAQGINPFRSVVRMSLKKKNGNTFWNFSIALRSKYLNIHKTYNSKYTILGARSIYVFGRKGGAI